MKKQCVCYVTSLAAMVLLSTLFLGSLMLGCGAEEALPSVSNLQTTGQSTTEKETGEAELEFEATAGETTTMGTKPAETTAPSQTHPTTTETAPAVTPPSTEESIPAATQTIPAATETAPASTETAPASTETASPSTEATVETTTATEGAPELGDDNYFNNIVRP